MEWFVKRTRIPAPAEVVYRWHTLPGALAALTPPWERVEVVDGGDGIRDGSRVTLRVRFGPFGFRWVAEHLDCIAGRQFRDVQRGGPFTIWDHTHRFEPDGPDACYLEDRVGYTLPMGWLGRAIAGAWVRRRLKRLFEYRHGITLRETAAPTD